MVISARKARFPQLEPKTGRSRKPNFKTKNNHFEKSHNAEV